MARKNEVAHLSSMAATAAKPVGMEGTWQQNGRRRWRSASLLLPKFNIQYCQRAASSFIRSLPSQRPQAHAIATAVFFSQKNDPEKILTGPELNYRLGERKYIMAIISTRI
jgi:hypothetical protein